MKRFLLLLTSVVFCITSFSQNQWDGDNAAGNLTYCNNWYSDACPSTWNSSTDLLFNYRNNASQTSLYNDFGSWKDIQSMIFATTFGASTPFNGGGNGFNFWYKIENNSSYNQTINLPLSAKGVGFELNAVNGDLTFTGIIYNDNNISGNIYNSNSKSTVLSNYIVGNNTVKLYLKNSNYGILKINCDMPNLSASAFQGGINVDRGELWFNAGAKINGGTLRIGNGDANVCKLYINATTGGTTVNNAVNVPTSSTNSFIGGLNTSGTNTYTGTFTLNNATTFENFGGGTLDIQGNITGSVGVNIGRISGIGNSIIRYSTNTKSYTGNTSIGANSTLQLSIASALPSTNNFSVASGGTLQISENQTIANLDLSGNGNLTVDAGKTLTITGTYIGGTGTINNQGTIILQGSSAQTFPGSGATISAMNNLTIDNATGVTLNKDITFSNSGTLAVNSSKVLIAGTQVISFGTSGNLTLNGTLKTSNINGFSGASNTTIANNNTPTITLGSSSTVEYNATGAQSITARTDYANLTISGSRGSATVTLPTSAVGISGSFTPSASSVTYVKTSNTIDFNKSTGGQTIPAFNYNNLTSSNSSGTQSASGTIDVAGVLTVASGGTLDMVTNALTGSSLTTSGTGTLRTQNTGATPIPTGRTWTMLVNYNANAAQTISSGIYSGGLTASNTSMATKTLGGNATISGALTLSTSKVAINGNTLTLNGTVSGMSASNSLVGSNTSKLTVTSTSSVGTVYFDQTTSADASTTSGTNALQNLVVSGAGGSITLGNKLNLFERLSVSAGTLNTGDLLVLRSVSGSGSNNTAYVDQVGGTIIGQVTVERYLHNQTQGWRALTAPVTYSGISQGYVSGNWQSNFGYSGNYGTRITGPSATNGIDDVTFSASLMTYNSTSGAWNKITNTTTETMAGANGSADNKGFFLFVRGDRTVTPNGYNPNAFVATTLAAKGKLQTGTQTFSYGGAANKAWLVGNPYACPIDMSAVTFNGSIPNFIYVWDPNRPSSYSGVTGSYVTFDRSSNWASPSPSAGSTTKYFQSGQCFFVVPTSASGVSVVFNESNKNTSNQNNQTAGTSNGLSDEFNIKLSYIKTDGSTAEIDGVRAKFGSSYSTLIDADDAYKWNSADIENMSLLRNNASLVIEARPHIISSDSLFLNITNLSVGSNYEFKVNPINFDASVSSCKLVDNFLNTETPISLTNTTLVSFNVSSVAGSNAANRFYVVFNAAGSLPTSNSLTVKAYKQNNNSIKIDWEAIAENNVKTYTVEKSTDAASFTKLSEATAKNGNTTNAYSIVDNNPVIGVNYYRIQSTATNNNKVYSTIVRVEMSDKGIKSITVYPNPVKSSTNTIGLQMNNLTAGSYTAVLYNTAGQQVWMNTMNHNGNNGSTSLQLNRTLASGTYQLQLTDSKGNSYKQTVLVVE